MGQKVHPTSFRIGTIYTWQSQWYAEKDYAHLLAEDRKIRDAINKSLGDAGVSRIEIENNANQGSVTIHTAKPGIVIGRGGQKVDELRTMLEKTTGRRIRVNIQEIRVPRWMPAWSHATSPSSSSGASPSAAPSSRPRSARCSEGPRA